VCVCGGAIDNTRRNAAAPLARHTHQQRRTRWASRATSCSTRASCPAAARWRWPSAARSQV
jgi:hypothetical protein